MGVLEVISQTGGEAPSRCVAGYLDVDMRVGGFEEGTCRGVDQVPGAGCWVPGSTSKRW